MTWSSQVSRTENKRRKGRQEAGRKSKKANQVWFCSIDLFSAKLQIPVDPTPARDHLIESHEVKINDRFSTWLDVNHLARWMHEMLQLSTCCTCYRCYKNGIWGKVQERKLQLMWINHDEYLSTHNSTRHVTDTLNVLFQIGPIPPIK